MAEKIDNNPIPFYVSRTLWGAAISIIASGLAAFNIAEISPAEVEQITSYVVAVVGAVGGLVVIWGRLTTRRPIAGTATAATAVVVIEEERRAAVATATPTRTAEAKKDIKADAVAATKTGGDKR